MEEKKYELVKEESITHQLYRIKAVKDFGNIKKGDCGGYIEKESNLSHHGNCWIYGNAIVSGDAKVFGNAIVSGDAIVSGNARIYGNAHVSGNAKIFGDVIVYNNAKIYGNAYVFGDASVCGNTMVSGNAKIFGDAHVCDNARISGDAYISGNAIVYGDAHISGNANILSNNDYLLLNGFGSVNRNTTFYKGIDGIIYVICGCFRGDIDEFRNKVIETHKDTFLAKEYLMVADLIELRFNNRKDKG